ncbi:uromodulin-like [Bombina bombina]|uniref:uromodulin-like n=1 Tax=Bombina bombina TaxID=8345 RepID=UPI00235AA283|nr:uromodulin-like [Bombina bombina]
MYDDFLQLKLVNSWLLDRVTARFPCGVRQYTMVEFNDPTVGPVKVTNSKTEFGHFFNSLVASGGGDCPELALEGLELALNNSPSNSFILVLTDASAKDYNDIALLNNIRSLINTTKSQVFFLITGLCMGLSDPQFLVYRDIALQSFGHVFQVDLFDLGKVFHYLDFTLSRPANTSTRLFSGEYTVGNHSDSFPVADNFTSLLVTTDGVIYSLKIVGPHNIDLELKKIVSEIWGSMYLLKNPIKGIWTMYIYAGGPHSVRVEGFTAINISSTANCSECDPNATCKEEMGFLECSCKDGFIGDGFTCTDIDECTYAWSNNCSFDCINTFGSYECLCRSGYSQISGNTCVDIDECSTSELNNCHPLASCQNYEGSYLCYCPSGYFGDGIYCEVDECSKDVCGFGVDCIKSNGSFHCSDPCSNYTILNDPWRSSANIYVSLWNCDHYINGWYRFIGSGGVRMPEYCVPTFSCDTAAPMWLSGSHPLLTDGIVNRTACAHWSDSCCLWSTTVQIKACPEGYHVYKLSGTPTCSLSYCTDPASANDSLTCAADEEWKVIDGEYGCHCKDKYKISGVEDLRPELVCEAHSMRAKFHKCQLKSLKLDIRNIRFRGSECFGFQNDNITNEFSVLSPLQDGICGVRLRKNATHAIYVNTLDFSLDYEDTVIREEQLSITLSCAYPLNMMVSLETAVRPIMSSTNISVDGTGQFTAHIALYQDSSYLSPYEGSEVVLSSKSTLYIGVIVDGVDSSEYTVVMKNCYATPTQNANDSIKYYIIKNSCPNRQDKTIKVMENGVSDKGRFSVQIFKFIGDYNLIFLHCEIKLCDPSASACTPTCSGSRAASDSNEQSFVLNVGPVVRGDVSLSSASGTHYPWTLFAFPLLFLTTILFNI